MRCHWPELSFTEVDRCKSVSRAVRSVELISNTAKEKKGGEEREGRKGREPSYLHLQTRISSQRELTGRAVEVCGCTWSASPRPFIPQNCRRWGMGWSVLEVNFSLKNKIEASRWQRAADTS